MELRRSGLAAAMVVPVAMILAGAAVVMAQAPSAHPMRTPWGDPDLQGVWTTEMLRDARVPYERPRELGSRLYLTDAEFAERRARAEKAGFRNASQTFRQTSLIVDPPDGRYPPLTAEAQRRSRVMSLGTYGVGPDRCSGRYRPFSG